MSSSSGTLLRREINEIHGGILMITIEKKIKLCLSNAKKNEERANDAALEIVKMAADMLVILSKHYTLKGTLEECLEKIKNKASSATYELEKKKSQLQQAKTLQEGIEAGAFTKDQVLYD